MFSHLSEKDPSFPGLEEVGHVLLVLGQPVHQDAQSIPSRDKNRTIKLQLRTSEKKILLGFWVLPVFSTVHALYLDQKYPRDRKRFITIFSTDVNFSNFHFLKVSVRKQ